MTSAASSLALLTNVPSYQYRALALSEPIYTVADQAVRPPGNRVRISSSSLYDGRQKQAQSVERRRQQPRKRPRETLNSSPAAGNGVPRLSLYNWNAGVPRLRSWQAADHRGIWLAWLHFMAGQDTSSPVRASCHFVATPGCWPEADGAFAMAGNRVGCLLTSVGWTAPWEIQGAGM